MHCQTARKPYLCVMIRRYRNKLSVASAPAIIAVFAVMTSPLAAQTTEFPSAEPPELLPEVTLPETQPPGEALPESGIGEEAVSGEAAAAPQALDPSTTHLNTLFEQLAKPGNPHWERVQRQIWAVWSRSGSASANLLFARAQEAIDAEDYTKALDFLNDLTRLYPDFAEAWNKRATVYFLQGNYGASMADIQRVLTLEPRHFGALSGMGIILDRTGYEAQALATYRRVIELHPHMEAAQKAIERLSIEVEGREL